MVNEKDLETLLNDFEKIKKSKDRLEKLKIAKEYIKKGNSYYSDRRVAFKYRDKDGYSKELYIDLTEEESIELLDNYIKKNENLLKASEKRIENSILININGF